jgi:hypothetical protein
MKNKTGLRGFDRLETDPRVVEIWSEGPDGYWIELAPGYNIEGCSCAHGWTVKATLAQLSLVERGEPY